MIRKIPEDAFEQYLALGLERSYQALADTLGVTKRAVQNCADREGWTGRLAKLERDAREKSDEEFGESMKQMRLRHLKLLRAMGSRVATGLRDYPLNSGMEAVRACEVLVRLERLLAGDATERTAVSVEQVTRAEIDKLLNAEPHPSDEKENDEDKADDNGDW